MPKTSLMLQHHHEYHTTIRKLQNSVFNKVAIRIAITEILLNTQNLSFMKMSSEGMMVPSKIFGQTLEDVSLKRLNILAGWKVILICIILELKNVFPQRKIPFSILILLHFLLFLYTFLRMAGIIPEASFILL